MRSRLLGSPNYAKMLESLRERRVNYEPHQVREPEWNFDEHRHVVARESPGPPEADHAWQIACGLVAAYEFSDPGIVRAVYHRNDSLLGRNMLLEGRFYGLRLYMGVRITSVVDELREGQKRVWGWSYETLEGHLERGKMTYEVIKDQQTGLVEFVIRGYSQGSHTLTPVMRAGWQVFGRATQLRFYRRCGRRLRRLVRATLRGAPPPSASRDALCIDDLVLAPSDVAPSVLDRVTVPRHDPGP